MPAAAMLAPKRRPRHRRLPLRPAARPIPYAPLKRQGPPARRRPFFGSYGNIVIHPRACKGALAGFPTLTSNLPDETRPRR